MSNLNCQATITTPAGIVNYLFTDQTTATNWVNSQAVLGAFGQNAVAAVAPVVLVPAIPAVPAVLDANGNVVTPAIAAVPAVMSSGSPAIPQAWSVVYTDISAQASQQALVAKGIARQSAGAQIIAQIYALNEANLAANTLSITQLTAMLEDASLATIERLLWNGSLVTALSLIQASVTIPTYFSSVQITQIVNSINAAIAAN